MHLTASSTITITVTPPVCVHTAHCTLHTAIFNSPTAGVWFHADVGKIGISQQDSVRRTYLKPSQPMVHRSSLAQLLIHLSQCVPQGCVPSLNNRSRAVANFGLKGH
ncbi:hypothetical protein ASPBRDRAFT_557046 [Aspergillus brasiliensis CBS 101740]|uniref:Uncharacterized protein n=1 Tax=Aspergillus brasiliensis (strain CBS 101740 / IMI 381727 / IBT 21946) TaxID=767769 RepID=A0A1L9UMC0_ASPBC|nr:hypothetical protein ASPBRDRAFT_557046 [Aspergillus brasiliensis CBS 101740]